MVDDQDRQITSTDPQTADPAAEEPEAGPTVFPLHNGPLYYFTDFTPQPVEGLTAEDGGGYATPRGAALCRCGASENKPFCDGGHSVIGFNDRCETDGHLDRRRSYEGDAITIHDNRGICSHAGICANELPGVFRKSGRPWIDPNGADLAKIRAVIEKCPSGALSYSVEGVEYRDYDREAKITVIPDGPYHLQGWVDVAGAEGRAEGVSDEHCALCRCGSSRNKPFCDGAHADIGFSDAPPVEDEHEH